MNMVHIDADTALKNVQDAGKQEIGAQSKCAWALMGVFQQAYEGNLTPAIALARTWSDTQRKRAATVLGYITSTPEDRESFRRKDADLRITTPDKGNGASLRKGWQDRRLDWESFEDFEKLILATCPTSKGKDQPIRHRASLRDLEKLCKAPTAREEATIKTVEDKTVKQVKKLGLMGVPDDRIEAILHEAFSRIDSVAKAAQQAAENARKEAEAKAKEKKAKAASNKQRQARRQQKKAA